MGIKLDDNNFRKHNKNQIEKIKNQITEVGFGRSILLDKNETIIAGNATYEAASATGLPVRIIESDGKEIIAIKRIDVEDSTTRNKLAIGDNSLHDLSSFDFEKIDTLMFNKNDLEALGLGFVDVEGEMSKFIDGKIESLIENNSSNKNQSRLFIEGEEEKINNIIAHVNQVFSLQLKAKIKNAS